MKASTVDYRSLLAMAPVLVVIFSPSVQAQSITPANDNTSTIVDKNGDRFDITGGSLSSDGANLFHSFQQFNLNKNQTANFISTPELNNILGRIVGGDPSLINGLIQVTGGNPNLYLMNPAGVIFGPHASLNIPASFTVTTGTGIGFNGNNLWFNSLGNNDYQNLIGTPKKYRFDLPQTGAIVNQGNLQLEPGQNLTLLAGTTMNTGELSTAGGKITIAAVEGENIVRISQPGHLLSLEVSPLTTEGTILSQSQQIQPLSLPELLTIGRAENNVTDLAVNERGQIILQAGSIDVSNNTQGGVGGEVNLLGDRLSILDSNINADGSNGGGNIRIGGASQGNLQGNNRLRVSQEIYVDSDSYLSANSLENGGGGEVTILSAGTVRFDGEISANGGKRGGNGGFVEVSGKQQLTVTGDIDVSSPNGQSGTILLDPESLIVGDTDELAADLVTDLTDEVAAGENNADVTISAENIGDLKGEIILQADNDITINEAIETTESVAIKAGRSINLNADINTAAGNANISLLGNDDNANLANRSSGAASINQAANTTLNAGSGNINIRLGNLGEVGEINLANLTTTGQILINANGGNIGTVSPNSLIAGGNAIFRTEGNGAVGLSDSPLKIELDNLEAVTGSGGAYFAATAPLTVGGVNRNLTGISTSGGGEVRLNAQGKITVTEDISTTVNTGQAGNVTLETTRGAIDATGATINSSSESGRGGNINLTAPGNIFAGNVNASSNSNRRGGNITFNAGRNIDTRAGIVYSSSLNGNGGNIDFTAGGNIITGDLTSASGGVADNVIDTNSLLGDIDPSLLGDLNLTTPSGGGNGNAGTITLNAQGNINTTGANISASTAGGDGGALAFTAGGNLNLGNLTSYSQEGKGGNVNLTVGGNANLEGIESYSSEGRGGNASITATGNVTTGNIDTYSLGVARGGNITINSGGEIDATNSNLRAYSSGGNSGNLNLSATGDINTAAVEAYSQSTGNGGKIVLESSGGNINTTAGNLETSSSSGSGGNVRMTAAGNLDTGEIDTRTFGTEGSSGNIRLESSGGTVNTTAGSLRADSKSDGGDISILAEGDISTGILESYSSGNGTGGQIQLTSNGGAIDTTEGNLNASSDNTGGNISLNASTNVTTGELNSAGSRQGGEINITSATGAVNTRRGSLDSSAAAGVGGNIEITAEGNVITGEVTAYGLLQSGNVTITSNSSDVNTTSEPDVSSEGTPGEVVVNAGEGSISLGDFDNVTVEEGGEDNPFGENSDADVTSDADKINRQQGDVSLEARNDITINEAIASDTIANLELKAGRSINVNADIDTSGGNGNIALQGNVPGDNAGGREAGPGNVTMAPGTTISAGRGNISIELGRGGDANPVGNITLGNLRSQGAIAINARGGDILRAYGGGATGGTPVVRAGSAIFQTTGTGAIGSASEPLRLRVENLEATAGSGGAFFNSPNRGLTIGGASDLLDGISTEGGGNLEVRAKGDITVTESLLTAVTSGAAGNIALNSSEGGVDTSRTALESKADTGNGGDVSITAAGALRTGNISSISGGDDGSGGNITLTTTDGSINTTAGEITSSSQSGNGGAINLVVGVLAGDGLSAGETDIPVGQAPPLSGLPAITVGNISSLSGGGGSGGKISLQTTTGDIDTTGGTLISRSQLGSGADINLAAEGNITTATLNSSSLGTGNGGNIALTSNSGAINTTAGFLESFADPQNGGTSGSGGNISLDASGNIDIAQLNTISRTGKAGDINLNSGGNITTTRPNSTNTGLFSNSVDGDGGNINLRAVGNLTASEIRTEAQGETSNAGSGGTVDIEAGGRVRVRSLIRSYGLEQSGDVKIQSQTGSISTRAIETIAPNGTSGNVTLVTGETPVLRAQGDVRTADITSEGGEAAGKIEIVAPDGSIRTEDLRSSSEEGEAGGIDLQAGEELKTEDQTVNSGEGDSNINNEAGGDIATGNQTATADNGNATINNEAGGDIATGNQTASATGGNASINNEAGGNISGGNQTATATGGNASINNEAGGNVNLRDQISTATGGNASINNDAGGNVNLRDQISTATGGNASINNEAGGNVNLRDQISTATGGNASISNQAGGNINGRDQVATATGGNASINNQAGGNIAIATQTTLAEGGNATINNDAGQNLTVGVQNATANGGVNTITNNAGGNLNVPQPPLAAGTSVSPVLRDVTDGLSAGQRGIPVGQTSRLSAPSVINNPASVLQNRPATTAVNNPASVLPNRPATTAVNNPASVLPNRPATTAVNNPASVLQNRPATTAVNNPASVRQNSPATTAVNNPASVLQNRPATTAVNNPASVLQNRPATTAVNNPRVGTSKSPRNHCGQ